MAEASHRTTRAESRRRWIGFIGFTASRAIEEYFEHKRDEGSAHDEEGDEEEEDSEEKKKPEEKEPDDGIPEWMKRTRVRVDDESAESAHDSSDEESRDGSESESESDDSENDDLNNGGRTGRIRPKRTGPLRSNPFFDGFPPTVRKSPGHFDPELDYELLQPARRGLFGDIGESVPVRTELLQPVVYSPA